MIRATTYPKGLRIDKTIKPYNSTARPATWLQDYSKVIHIAAGNPNVAVKYLPLMLTGTARQWIDDLPEKSICNWLDMHQAFTNNLEGTFKCPVLSETSGVCKKRMKPPVPTSLAGWI